MGFLSICVATYDYTPQGDGELEIQAGEILYVLEKSADDDWWRAKKKATDEDEDEPEGLVPNNYVEDAKPSHTAKALYDYTRQTDEEVSFTEDAALDVYDISDPDWTLVGVGGEFGFAPANYIELSGATPKSPSIASPTQYTAVSPTAATTAGQTHSRPPSSPTASTPAANLARVLGGAPASPSSRAIPNPVPVRQAPTPDPSDGEDEGPPPSLPRRPESTALSPPPSQFAVIREDESPGVLPSPPYNRAVPPPADEDAPVQHRGGFRLYSISEMVSAMGRRRKMPVTLGLNIATGTIMLAPEKTRDGPSQEWAAEKMTHYSIEGKHVFMEMIRPSKSLDLHAGSRDTAEEIVAALSEIAGASKAEGLSEIIAAASGSNTLKRGVVLYEFMAQGDDEVTVAVADEVIILDDSQSEEWWNVRRVKNGKEGVMPSSYIEITGTVSAEKASQSGLNAGRSVIEQNRIEEERLTKEAAKASKVREEAEARSREVGPGLPLPERGSSLPGEDTRRGSKRDKRSNRTDGKSSRSKPDPAKVRTWTDQSGTFKVDAQFIAVADGKIQLHKVNGVKIAVPVTKMSPADLEYVEKVTNEPIDDNIPLADLIKLKRQNRAGASGTRTGATIQSSQTPEPKTSDYDWFSFFLEAGVGPHQCERYSQAMIRDAMDESVLPDVTEETLRSLGLRAGDALKVIKHIDQKYNRKVNGEGNLFTGPGGAVKDNTRKRPEANRQIGDVVDAKAIEQGDRTSDSGATKDSSPQNNTSAIETEHGFGGDDAWIPKPPSQPLQVVNKISSPPPQNTTNPLTGTMAELSELEKPLEPSPAPAQIQQAPASIPEIPPAPAPTIQAPQHTGANPPFFAQLNQPQLQAQATLFQQMPPRQRPQAPLSAFQGNALLSPPPRPTSAPQNTQQNQFSAQPLQAQLTGIPRTSALQAAPGQSLDELTAQRMQQPMAQFQLQPQQTGFLQPMQQYGQFQNGLVPQQMGFQQQQFGQFQPMMATGNVAGSPFADPRPSFQPQPTGFNNFQPQNAPGGINSILPPALVPQRTGLVSPPPQQQQNGFGPGFQAQPTGFQQPMQPQMTAFQQPIQAQPTGFGGQKQNGFNDFRAPPVPPMPSQPTVAPLMPQKTGPAPSIRFGVPEAKKLAPQPTSRRANLSQATAQNPFGF